MERSSSSRIKKVGAIHELPLPDALFSVSPKRKTSEDLLNASCRDWIGVVASFAQVVVAE
jgi:hypothetical protein